MLKPAPVTPVTVPVRVPEDPGFHIVNPRVSASPTKTVPKLIEDGATVIVPGDGGLDTTYVTTTVAAAVAPLALSATVAV
jgi:hypothetical protein